MLAMTEKVEVEQADDGGPKRVERLRELGGGVGDGAAGECGESGNPCGRGGFWAGTYSSTVAR